MAKAVKRVFVFILLIFTCACFLAGCFQVPKNEVRANLLSSRVTYEERENRTKIIVLFDVLNGKKRSIDSVEADVTFTFKDGTTREETIIFEEDIEYSYSSPVRYTFYVEGRVDEGVFTAFRFEMMTYWESFGSAIIGFCIGFLVLGFVFMFFAMAEMTGILSIGAGAVVLFDIAFLLFSPFTKAIIVILSSLLAFVPMLVRQLLDY